MDEVLFTIRVNTMDNVYGTIRSVGAGTFEDGFSRELIGEIVAPKVGEQFTSFRLRDGVLGQFGPTSVVQKVDEIIVDEKVVGWDFWTRNSHYELRLIEKE